VVKHGSDEFQIKLNTLLKNKVKAGDVKKIIETNPRPLSSQAPVSSHVTVVFASQFQFCHNINISLK